MQEKYLKIKKNYSIIQFAHAIEKYRQIEIIFMGNN